MAGFDKALLREKLLALGWTEALPEYCCEDDPNLYLTPPEGLWKDRPKVFYLYDAKDLQSLLGDFPDEDDSV